MLGVVVRRKDVIHTQTLHLVVQVEIIKGIIVLGFLLEIIAGRIIVGIQQFIQTRRHARMLLE